jgi:hypothetical protein
MSLLRKSFTGTGHLSVGAVGGRCCMKHVDRQEHSPFHPVERCRGDILLTWPKKMAPPWIPKPLSAGGILAGSVGIRWNSSSNCEGRGIGCGAECGVTMKRAKKLEDTALEWPRLGIMSSWASAKVSSPSGEPHRAYSAALFDVGRHAGNYTGKAITRQSRHQNAQKLN